MNRYYASFTIQGLTSAILLFGLIFASESGFAKDGMSGTFMVVKGQVFVISPDKPGDKVKAKIGTKILPGQSVETGPDSRAKIVMADKNTINVTPESLMKFEKYENNGKGEKDVLLNVIYGKMRAEVKEKYEETESSRFRVKTPSAVAGVRGTDFLTSYNPANQASRVVTFEGAVEVGTPGPAGQIMNSVRILPGEFTQTVAGSAPTPPAKVPQVELKSMNAESSVDSAGAGPAELNAGGGVSPSGESKSDVESSGPSGGDERAPAKSPEGEGAAPKSDSSAKPSAENNGGNSRSNGGAGAGGTAAGSSDSGKPSQSAGPARPSLSGGPSSNRGPSSVGPTSSLAPKASDLPSSPGSTTQPMTLRPEIPQAPLADSLNAGLQSGGPSATQNLQQIQQVLQNVQETVQNLGSSEVLIRVRFSGQVGQ